MRAINHLLFTSAIAMTLLLTARQVGAQQDNQSGGGQRQGNGQRGGRQRQGNFDPAQAQERMLQRYRERLEITDDQEWKAIQPRVQKVMDARQALFAGGRGMFGRGGRPGGDTNQSDQQRQRRNVTQPNPAAEGLQLVVDNKASTSEVKAAIAKYMEYRKAKQADLEKAQEELRGVLTSRQEAIAVLSGLL
jgi:hypothetical protein